MAGPLEGVVTHKFIDTNGIKLHYVEAGSGPTVLLLHGFPDTWYGWRHQIPALVTAGYHVVAPDLRGFGQSDIPDSPEQYTSLHICGDLIGLLDALQVKQALVVGHDWGCVYGADLALFRPDRVKVLVLLSVGYFPRESTRDVVENIRLRFGDDMYQFVFQEPGRAEAIFKTAKSEDILSAFMLRMNDDPNHMRIPPFFVDEPLPEWLTKEDLKAYAQDFDKTGWTGGLNHYRAAQKSWELKAPWTNAPLPAQVPTLVMIGRQDITYTFLGLKDINDEKAFVLASREMILNLKALHFIDASHFLHQEKPVIVNKCVLEFLEQYNS